MSIYSDLSELITSIKPVERPSSIYVNEYRYVQLKFVATNYTPLPSQLPHVQLMDIPIMIDNDLKDNEYKQNGKIHKFEP